MKSKYERVEFFGQDDKAKIPVGDKVPASIGARANNKGIVVVSDKTGLVAKITIFTAPILSLLYLFVLTSPKIHLVRSLLAMKKREMVRSSGQCGMPRLIHPKCQITLLN